MPDYTGVVLKVKVDDHKIFINETWFLVDEQISLAKSLMGKSVTYRVDKKGKMVALEVIEQEDKELKGKIQSLNLTIPRISLHTGGQLLHFYITPKHFYKIKYQYKPGDFLTFTYNPVVVTFKNSSYFVITDIKDKKKPKSEDTHGTHKELQEKIRVLTDASYYAFLDLEFSMSGPEYRGENFQAEILQFGIIVADQEGNLVEKFSSYVKPTLFPNLSEKTQEFLKVPAVVSSYGISYQEFYHYIQEVMAKYNPVFLVWGVSDRFILENSYVINQVPPLFESHHLIDLQKVHRQYFQIGQDIGLYNAVKSYNLSMGTQIHDAIVDAVALYQIFYEFKAVLSGKEKHPFKDNYTELMTKR